MPFGIMACPICRSSHEVDELSSEHVVIGWRSEEQCFQLSNAVFIHRGCLSNVTAQYLLSPTSYATGDLGDDEFRTEE